MRMKLFSIQMMMSSMQDCISGCAYICSNIIYTYVYIHISVGLFCTKVLPAHYQEFPLIHLFFSDHLGCLGHVNTLT